MILCYVVVYCGQGQCAYWCVLSGNLTTRFINYDSLSISCDPVSTYVKDPSHFHTYSQYWTTGPGYTHNNCLY